MKNAVLFLLLIILMGLTTIEFQKKVVKKPINLPTFHSFMAQHPTPLPAGFRSFDGEYICLPPKQKPNPTAWTLECASGLKLSDGSYVGLSTSDRLDKNLYTKGTKLHVSGLFKPVEQLSKTAPEKYPIIGVVTVKEVSK